MQMMRFFFLDNHSTLQEYMNQRHLRYPRLKIYLPTSRHIMRLLPQARKPDNPVRS